MERLSKRNFLIVAFLLINSFVWFYVARAVIADLTAHFEPYERTLISGAYFSAIIMSSFLGAFLSERVSALLMLRMWMALECFATSLFMFLSSTLDISVLMLVVFFNGTSFGVGMPSCLASFAELTDFDNRGVAGGFTFLTTNLIAFALTLFSITWLLWVSLTLRIAGLAMLFLSRTGIQNSKNNKKPTSFKLIFQNRALLLYAVPWLTFCLVDKFERVYFKMFFEPSFFRLMDFVEPLVGTIFVFVGGLLADRAGRKHVLIYGFVALGLGYAAIGLAPYMDISRYFYIFVDGVAWGIFMVIYMLVLWGDFSTTSESAEKWYTLGSLPFFLSDFVVLFFSFYLEGISSAGAYAIFSLASFFLFVAVVPLMFAPETLPEKKIRERELKEYVEKAKKIREKYV